MKKKGLKAKLTFFLLIVLLVITSNVSAGSIGGKNSAVEPTYQQVKPVKYVFFFVGDGLGIPQINATEAFANALVSKDVRIKNLSFSKFPVTGINTTYDAGSLITDSASAGTAFASGNKTLNGVINMDVTKTRTYTTIAEYAKMSGRKVGVVSSVSIDHATPASMYAKSASRGYYYEIAIQLALSDFDYFGGGGFLQPKGKSNDLTSVIDLAKSKGYLVANTRDEILNLKPSKNKVLAINPVLQDSAAMKYEIDREEGELSLADFVRKGIELLKDGPNGFFFFIEGGKIDWACHANDAAAVIWDTLAFDRAVAEAIAFAEKYPKETLIVVTGDHETGGMSIGFAGTQYETFFHKIIQQKMSHVAFNEKVIKPYKANTPKDKAKLTDLEAAIKNAFGIELKSLTQLQYEQVERAFKRTMGIEVERNLKDEEFLLYGGYEPLTVKLTQILNQMAGIGWTSYAHTGAPVPIFAKGVNQELFAGYYDNTDIFHKLMQAMGLKATVSK